MSNPWHSYILRVWHEPDHTPPQWRITLRTLPDDKWHIFPTLLEAMRFIEQMEGAEGSKRGREQETLTQHPALSLLKKG